MVSRSSTEAEFRALADTTCEVTWIQCLLKEFQVTVPTPVSMLCGNASSIALASNPVHHARSKHIEIDCHFVRDKVKAGQILTQYVFNKNQLADILTKCLSRPLHYNCLSKLGMCNPYTLPTCEGDDETVITPGSKHPNSVIKRDAKHSVQSIQILVTLSTCIKKPNGYPSPELLRVTRDTTSGLVHLHELGIIHRDLKPHIMLIRKDRSIITAKVSNMGISKRLPADMPTRLSFLRDASDYVDFEDRVPDSSVLKALESIGTVVLGGK
ncbi:homogeneously-staining region [Tanacetum coccineum]